MIANCDYNNRLGIKIKALLILFGNLKTLVSGFNLLMPKLIYYPVVYSFKVGGLGDVVCSLCKALQKKGHLVEVLLPKYDCMQYDRINNLKVQYVGGFCTFCFSVFVCSYILMIDN